MAPQLGIAKFEPFEDTPSLGIAKVEPLGLLVPGNIDLVAQPRVKNPDGTVSTVRSLSFEEKGREILIPTVVGNRVVSDKAAIENYHRTGKHLGIFDNADAATEYAKQLHDDYAAGKYDPKTLSVGGVPYVSGGFTDDEFDVIGRSPAAQAVQPSRFAPPPPPSPQTVEPGVQTYTRGRFTGLPGRDVTSATPEPLTEGAIQIAKGAAALGSQLATPPVLPAEPHVMKPSAPGADETALNGLSDVLDGSLKVGTPLAVGAAIVDLPATAFAFGVGALGSYAAGKAADVVGATPAQKRFAETFAAATAATGLSYRELATFGKKAVIEAGQAARAAGDAAVAAREAAKVITPDPNVIDVQQVRPVRGQLPADNAPASTVRPESLAPPAPPPEPPVVAPAPVEPPPVVVAPPAPLAPVPVKPSRAVPTVTAPAAPAPVAVEKFEPETPADHDYASTQINLPVDVASKVTAFGATIPDEHLAKDGREDQPHVTVKFGLHGNDPEKVRELLADEPPITVTLGKTSIFPNGESDAGDVVKVDVVNSPGLHRLNAKIAAALEHTDTHPDYKPHVTIAYVKPGQGEQYAGSRLLAGKTFTVDSIVFSGKKGEQISIPLGGRPAIKAAKPYREDVLHITTPQGAAGIRAEGFDVNRGQGETTPGLGGDHYGPGVYLADYQRDMGSFWRSELETKNFEGTVETEAMRGKVALDRPFHYEYNRYSNDGAVVGRISPRQALEEQRPDLLPAYDAAKAKDTISDRRAFGQVLREAGYDGLVIEHRAGDEVVAFDAKSVTWNAPAAKPQTPPPPAVGRTAPKRAATAEYTQEPLSPAEDKRYRELLASERKKKPLSKVQQAELQEFTRRSADEAYLQYLMSMDDERLKQALAGNRSRDNKSRQLGLPVIAKHEAQIIYVMGQRGITPPDTADGSITDKDAFVAKVVDVYKGLPLETVKAELDQLASLTFDEDSEEEWPEHFSVDALEAAAGPENASVDLQEVTRRAADALHRLVLEREGQQSLPLPAAAEGRKVESEDVTHVEPDQPRAADSGALAGAPAKDGSGAVAGGSAGPSGVRGAGTDAPGGGRSSGEGPTVPGGVREPEPGVGVPSDRGGSADTGERPPARVERPRAHDGRIDYRITEDDHLGEGGDAAKIDANLAAIKLLKQLQTEGRRATPDEQRVLVKYVGWGAFSERIFQTSFGKPADKRGVELKALLTDEEYAAARASTKNAHYTSPTVVKAIYDALQRIGFSGGRALEPAIGTGNFVGLMPADVTARTTWSGTELDTITAGIAQQLYQTANIENAGLEKAKLPNGFFDLVVSNVPFGSYEVFDPAFAKRPKALSALIHNYFFAKALDLVRPGGIVAFITSDGTLDATRPFVREYLSKHAELLGAIRLPKTAFEKNAGTEVVTDVIFLKRREQPLDAAPAADRWVHTGELTLKGEDGMKKTVPVNQYFLDNPTMVVGTHSLKGTMYRGGEYTVLAPSGDFGQQLAERVKALPENVYTKAKPPKSTTPLTTRQAVPAPDEVKRDAFTVRDGKLWQRQGDELVSVDAATPAATKARIVGMIRIRQALFDTMRVMLDDAPVAEIKAKQKALERLYDAFVQRHGYLSERGNIWAFDDDPDLPRLLALEDYDPIEKTAKKADIFTKRTLEPPKPVTHVDEPDRAMLVALNETGRLDWNRIEQLTGQSQAQLQEALQGLVYKNPSGEWQTADDYLSGDVKTKLEQAEAAARIDGSFAANVEALKKVIPEDIPPSKISLRLGAGWIPTDVVQAFIAHLLNSRPEATRVTYVAPLAQWTLAAGDYVRGLTANTETWGTPRATAIELIDDTMNLRSVTVYDTVKNADGSTSRVVNQDDTQAARERQQAIRVEFEKWFWADAARRDQMLRVYNDSQNRTRRRSFDGSHLELPGMAIINPSKPRNEQLRPHQKDGIWRSLQTPNMLAAHVVGAGKTYLIIGSAMEKRRQGIAKKPVVGVPNHLVTQWARAFADMYPTSNVLSVRKKDFEKANRQRFMAKIATGDWDAVIVPHSVLTRIPLRDETWDAFFGKQLQILEQYIEELTAAEGKKSKTVKQMEAMKKRLLVKMEKRAAKAKERTDDTVFWEELGIDALYVDEAHLFKNLWFPTKMTRISGLPNSESDRAFDMLLKVRHTQKLNNGGGVFFATGTPVSNTMAEMFTMQRYLQPEVLEERGLEHFDAWAQMFGDTRTTMEVSPEGSGFRMKTSFSRFTNMGRLSEMFRTFADVKTAKDLNLPVPKLKGGVARAHTVEASPALKAYVKHLTERAEAIRAGKVKDPRQDNMLKITSEGRKGALDMRLLDLAYGDDPNSKLNEAVKEIHKTWKEWGKQKGTQLVFSDLGTPKKKSKPGEVAVDDDADESESDALAQIRALNASDFDLYNDVKSKLVKLGIPAEEIAFIHDANTDARKIALFDNVNSGKVRILMGSTEKMGAGMNVQRLLVRLHQLDAPWRPSDVEQRTGRILRQGNHFYSTLKGFEVEITNYITKGSFDAYIWQTLERKAGMIEQGLSGLEDGQDVEDVGGGPLNAAEMKAASSGNPMVLEKVKADAELRQLESLKRSHQDKLHRLESKTRYLPASIQSAKSTIAGAQAFNDKTKKPDPFTIRLVNSIDGKKFTMFDDRAEASAHLAKLADEARTIAMQQGVDNVHASIGSYAGHDLFAVHYGTRNKDWQGEIRTATTGDLSVSTGMSSVTRPRELTGWITSLDYAIFKHPDTIISVAEASIPKYEKELADTHAELKASAFPNEARIAELIATVARIDKELDLDAKSQAAEAPVVAEDDDAATPAPKKKAGGTTLQSTILPGAAEFGEHVLEPAVKAVAAELRKHTDDLKRLFAPDTVTPHAERTAGILRANLAARAQRTVRARAALRATEKMMDGWSSEQSMQFWDVMEGQAAPSTLDPETRSIADLYRHILDTKRGELLKRDLIRQYLEHYWGHEWQLGSSVEQAIRRLFGKRPLQGPESYRKRRSIPTMREGIEEHHLQPVSWNPTTQLLRKLLEMDKSIAAHDIKRELKARGEAKFVAAGKKPPEGWVRYPESFGTVYGPQTVTTKEGTDVRIPFGRLVAGHYYGPAETVRLLENHLSPGLRGKSALYDLYRNAGNFLNQLQLGLSAFHFMMVGMESIVSKQALAFEQLVRGQFAPALKSQATVPIAPLLDVFRGHKALKAFYAHDANAAEIDDMIGQIVNAGGGFGWDLFEHSGAPEAFMTNLRGAAGAVRNREPGRFLGELAKAGLRSVPALVELTAKPIMEGWVPRLKIAAFLDLAAMELQTLGPEPDLEEVRRVLGAAWDSIDNRFGQLRYDNLFWNNVLKDLGMGSVRALGWNIGTVREMFGVVPAQLKQLGITGGGGGRPPRRVVNTGTDDEGFPKYESVPESRLHRKMAWFLAMVISYGLAGALYMYLRTGKRPESLKDYFFPQNGETDSHGKPVRVSIAGYFKDLYHVMHALPGSAVETAKAKVHPLLSLIADVVTNEDFFGTEIRNADDPLVEQARDVMKYALRESIPISVQQATEHRPGATTSQKVEGFFGITKAPASVTRTPLETYLHDIAPPTHRTGEQAEKAGQRRELREAVRSTKPGDARPPVDTSRLGPGEIKQTIKGARRSGLEFGIQRATMQQALKAYTLATPDERSEIKGAVSRKLPAALQSTPPAERKALMDAYRTAMALPMTKRAAGF